MDTERDVVIVGAARTAIGSFGGALRDVPVVTLGVTATRAALARAGVAPERVDHAVFGNVIPGSPRDCYLARVIAVESGVPVERPALTVNRLCGSGAEAIVQGARMIRLGEADTVLAGGAESMSASPYAIDGARFGRKTGDAPVTDWLVGALSDPFGHGHMGVTAETVADRHGIGRARQDEAAAESHRRAARAIAEGRFRAQIAPVEAATRRGVTAVDTDEHVRPDVTVEDLAKLRPVFRRDGTVTAGNASGINDGAAALLLMARRAAEERGVVPLARLSGYGHAGVPPEIMGMGPVEAVPRALARAGLSLADVAVIESNEAFAAQACAVADALGFDPARTNPNGGAVALGHPVGATGAILAVKALYELDRIDGRHALVTLCIGGGQGIALVLERLAPMPAAT